MLRIGHGGPYEAPKIGRKKKAKGLEAREIRSSLLILDLRWACHDVGHHQSQQKGKILLEVDIESIMFRTF